MSATIPQAPAAPAARAGAIRVTYDRQVDASYVYLVDAAHRSRPVRQVPAVIGVSFDLDATGRILGVEILDAKKRLRPETIDQAEGGPVPVESLLEPLDLLVLAASRGEREALEKLAREAGPLVLREARRALGGWHAQYAEDVAQDFWVELAARNLVFPLMRGAAKAWIKRRVRHLAEEHLRMGGGR